MPYLMTPSKKQKNSQGFDFQPKQKKKTNKQTLAYSYTPKIKPNF